MGTMNDLIYQIQNKLKNLLSNRFIRNLGWMSGAEFGNRIIRLVATVFLARLLTSYDYGLAAIVLTTYEFSYIFTKVGISQKLVQADEESLEELCVAAYWLNWLVFFGIFCIQCLAAFPIAWFYRDPQLILPICITALPYLILPISSIQGTLIYRENRLKIIALNQAIGVSSSNILSLIFAFLGMGLWAIILPRVLVAPIWVYICYVNHPWRIKQGFTRKRWGEIFNFGKNILGVELLKTLVNNLDYLIVGRFLGIRELGFYYFAFNAGLGISLSLIKAFYSTLLPHLCSLQENLSQLKQQYFKSLKVIAAIIIPLVLLQSFLAPLYVPIVFGEKWIDAIPVLMLICLSAIPRPFGDAASQLLIAIGKPDLNLRWSVIFTSVFIASLFIGIQWQAIGVAFAVLIVHFTLFPLFAIWATRYAFKTKFV